DLGALHLIQARTDEAIVWLEKARSAYAGYTFVYRWLAAAYGLKGDTERAVAALGKASNRFPTIASLKAAPSSQWLQGPKIRVLAEATFFAGLRKAGMPEDAVDQV